MSPSRQDPLTASLREEELAGAFFFHGDAGRLREEAANRVVEAALDPATRDFNLSRFRGEDADPEALAAVLAMPPMMAERRVVRLSDAQGLSPTGRKVLQEVVEAMPPGLTLVVTAAIPKGSRAAFYRIMKERCRSFEWSTPREEALPGWLIERAGERYGVRLSRRAAQALAGAVGPDLSLLDSELEKLAASGEERISLDRVRMLVPRSRRMGRWEWLDLVATRRYERALEALDGLLSADSAVGLLMAMVDQHVLLGVAGEGGVGKVRAALSEAGKGYLQWKAPVYARQAGRWDASSLERALRLMLRTDRRLKTGADDRAAFQELLLGLRLLREAA